MTTLYELHQRPDLESPVLLMALEGWIDAGLGAQQARAAIAEQVDSYAVANFDSDALLDHRARRPTMQLVDGVHAGLIWPAIELRAATDLPGREFLLLTGAEPDHHWRAFASAVADLALDLDVSQVVGLGAYPAPVPHTRPVGLATTATSSELARQVGFVPGAIAVPAGIQAAIEVRCGELGVAAVGLWAQVPHYAAAMPYPAAAKALLDGVRQVTGLHFDTSALADEAQRTRERLDELVANSAEHRELVRQLEEQADSAATTPGIEIPTGDELAAELEKFLREQGPGAGGN